MNQYTSYYIAREALLSTPKEDRVKRLSIMNEMLDLAKRREEQLEVFDLLKQYSADCNVNKDPFDIK
jgi:hypothetical protein